MDKTITSTTLRGKVEGTQKRIELQKYPNLQMVVSILKRGLEEQILSEEKVLQQLENKEKMIEDFI